MIHELVHGGGGIPRAEIDAQISEVQESLKRDALPIDEEIDALMVALEQLPEFATTSACSPSGRCFVSRFATNWAKVLEKAR